MRISAHICEEYENDCRDNMGISTSTDETRAMHTVLFDMLGDSQTPVEKKRIKKHDFSKSPPRLHTSSRSDP